MGNIFRRYPIAPAPEWSSTTTWKEFIRSHMDVLAGTDFFTVEVLTWRGFITYYILFFIEIGSRRVSLGGILTAPKVPEQVRHEAPCCTVMLPATKRHVGQNLTPERLGKSSHFVANGIFRGAQRQVGEPAARVSHLARITPDRPM